LSYTLDLYYLNKVYVLCPCRSENTGDPSLSHVSTFIFRQQPRGFWHAIYLLNVVVGHGTRVVFIHMPLHSFVVTCTGCSFYKFM